DNSQPHYPHQMTSRSADFHRLHQSGCFVMPNPWDIGSAKLLVSLGFPAVATTSAGLGWSLARRDGQVSLDATLANMRAIAGSVEVPVNADFEDGLAVERVAMATNVLAAATSGVAGLSIEDSTGNPGEPLLDTVLSVERIKAARRAIDEAGTGVVLTARSEGF